MKNLAGETLLDRFRLDELENQDDLGDIYAGRDLKRDLPVSVHVLSHPLPYDPTILAFQSENLTLQTLAHPNIVPFYGLYQGPAQAAPEAGGELTFLVERYVDGSTLQDLLLERRGQPVSIRDAMIYLKALCAALGYAHRFGLVHSHVRPADIRIADDGRVLLGGFGFARSSGSGMTSTGLSGLPSHLAPEVIRRETVSPATDVYGAGLILFELLTGLHPFLGARRPPLPPPAIEQLISAHLLQPPADPSRLNPAIPPGLAQTILTALEKDPAERYQNIQEMLEIACAVTGYTPDEVPGRLTPASTLDQTLIGLPPAGLPSVPATETPPPAAPASGPPAAPAQDLQAEGRAPGAPGVPTLLVGPDLTAGAAYAGPAHTAPVLPPEAVYPAAGAPTQVYPFGDEEPRPNRRRVILPAAIGGIILLLCIAAAAVAGAPLLRGLIGAPGPTGVTPLPSPTAGVTPPPGPTSAPPSQTPRQALPGLLESATPAPTATPTPAPSATPQPSSTPPPTAAPSAFTVTIRNNTANPIYAFRDDRLMGTDPIPPARYIYYKSIPPGMHTFKFCLDIQGRNCVETRRVSVDQDLTITVP